MKKKKILSKCIRELPRTDRSKKKRKRKETKIAKVERILFEFIGLKWVRDRARIENYYLSTSG